MTRFGPTIKWKKSHPHHRKKPKIDLWKITGCAQIQEIERPDGISQNCHICFCCKVWMTQLTLLIYKRDYWMQANSPARWILWSTLILGHNDRHKHLDILHSVEPVKRLWVSMAVKSRYVTGFSNLFQYYGKTIGDYLASCVKSNVTITQFSICNVKPIVANLAWNRRYQVS
jgi:hypothetical protein